MIICLKKNCLGKLEIITLFNKDNMVNLEIINYISIEMLEKSMETLFKEEGLSPLHLFTLDSNDVDILMEGVLSSALKDSCKAYYNSKDAEFKEIIETLNFKTFENIDFGKYSYTILDFILGNEKSKVFFPISDF